MAQKNIEKAQKTFYDDSYLKYVLYFLLALFVYVFIVNAWVGDDAYITFRTVDNFVNGYGLTWNTSERVQAYTHPLWMFIHSIFYAITRNIYYTTMFLSFAFSFLAIWLFVYKFAAYKLMAIAGLILLLISKTFIDYTSSGLENPLTYFLLILFLLFYFNKDEVQKKLFKLSLLTALLMLNRMDLVLIVIPALIYLLIKNWKAKQLLYVFYGFIPLILWEIFSIIYYGFPFPNTYYAKLNTGIPFGEYISQGFQYYYAQLNYDPITLIIFLASIIFSIYINTKRKDYVKEFIIFLGVFLYLLYILRIGGDFMCGRFFAVPLFLSIIVLTHIDFRNFGISNKIIPFVLLFLTTFMFIFTREPALLTTINYGSGFSKYKNDNDKIWEQLYRATGVADEKKFYYSKSGLLTMLFNSRSTPDIIEIKQALGSKKSNYNNFIRGYIGYFGYYLGQKKDIIDNLALSDPLLARLSSSKDPNWTISNWRIGHFYRRIPLGYLETKNTGENQLENKSLKEYYEKIDIVTKTSIFSSNRFAEIWRLNTGYYDDLLVDDYKENDEPKIYSGDKYSLRVYYWRLGHFYSQRGQLNQAIDSWMKLAEEREFINESNNISDVLYNIGYTYNLLNKSDSAICYAKKSIEIEARIKGKLKTLNFLFQVYNNIGSRQNALEVLKGIIKLDSNSVFGLNNYAIYCYDDGKEKEAVGIWHRLIKISPNFTEIYYNLYAVYLNKMNYDSAAYYAFKTIEMGGKVNSQTLEFLKKYKH